jgi:hypothetical protein
MSLGSSGRYSWGRVLLTRQLATFEAFDLSERKAQEARAMQATTSRQGDPVMTRAHSARVRTPTPTGSAPPCPEDVPGAPSAQAQPMDEQDRGDLPLVDLWKQAAVAVAGWLVLLGLALLALSTVAQQPPPAPPVAPVRSNVVAPGFHGIQSQQPGPGVETTQ